MSIVAFAAAAASVRGSRASAQAPRLSAEDVARREQDRVIGDRGRTDVPFIMSADRSFVRERYRLRAFGVANVSQHSGFARLIASMELRDDLALEASGAWLTGDSDGIFGRLSDSDFASLRLKYHF
jgi:hypothetical protein